MSSLINRFEYDSSTIWFTLAAMHPVETLHHYKANMNYNPLRISHWTTPHMVS